MKITLAESNKEGFRDQVVSLGDPHIRDTYARIERYYSKQVEKRIEKMRNMQVKAAGKNKDIKISY